ncbi:MAG: alcohol dehydrogenase catalytic domain-containing protein [Reichenbachiella sp.]
MQQLYFVKKEKLEWREVPTLILDNKKEAIVRPFAVAKCDLDDAFLFNNLPAKLRIGSMLNLIDPNYSKNFGKLLHGPFPFGHECVAEVVEVGDDVSHIKVCDVVTVPFQISCGTCINCQLGNTSTCDTVPQVSTFGFGKHLEFGGAMSDYLKVPFADSMLIKIPGHIDPIHLASLSDNIPDAYRHVASLEEDNNKSILIIGGKAKSVGIYTVLLAKALGAAQIDYVDNNPERLYQAKACGADNVFDSFKQLVNRYDIVVDANSTTKGLQAAFKAVRNYGTVTSSGIYLKKTPVSLIDMYAKGVTFKIGLTKARTDAEKVLNLVNKGILNFEAVTSKLDTWDNAIEAFLTDTTKVIVTRDRLTSL